MDNNQYFKCCSCGQQVYAVGYISSEGFRRLNQVVLRCRCGVDQTIDVEQWLNHGSDATYNNYIANVSKMVDAQIKTVGDLRTAIEGLPDEMPVNHTVPWNLLFAGVINDKLVIMTYDPTYKEDEENG